METEKLKKNYELKKFLNYSFFNHFSDDIDLANIFHYMFKYCFKIHL